MKYAILLLVSMAIGQHVTASPRSDSDSDSSSPSATSSSSSSSSATAASSESASGSSSELSSSAGGAAGCTPGSEATEQIECRSTTGQRVNCFASGGITGITIVLEYSQNICEYGRTYAFAGDYIQVLFGCEALFDVTYTVTCPYIQKGDFHIIFTSPEALECQQWRNCLFGKGPVLSRICVLAVDEAHLIQLWGRDFRPAFSRLGDLRGFLPDIPILILTATCTDEIKASILKCFHMADGNIDIVTRNPDRPNIFLSIKSTASMEFCRELEFYVNELKERGVLARKAIIYTRNVIQLGKRWRDMMVMLGESGYGKGKKLSERIVATYHSELEKSDQDRVLEIFSSPNSKIRCVIATIAFGMGLNIPDIGLIIHWGPSNNIAEYWQEVGRAGRDGRQAEAHLFAIKADVHRCEDSMKQLCKSLIKGESCMRSEVLKLITLSVDISVSKDNCFDNCTQDSICSKCSCCSICMSRCECRNEC